MDIREGEDGAMRFEDEDSLLEAEGILEPIEASTATEASMQASTNLARVMRVHEVVSTVR